jgi:GDPmannose 4,6-dehydratase
MKRTALIVGITGQDGSYMAEFLLEKGYEVHGIRRRSSSSHSERISHLEDRIAVHYGDLLDQHSIQDVVSRVRPDEIYNLGAQSFVPVSWQQPILTAEVTGLGTTRILDTIRELDPEIRFYQASSSEMFGKVHETPQRESTPFYPCSPYAVAKVYGHYITVNYRESYGLFACSGILFNHESPRRGLEFVTRKITHGVARIKAGLTNELRLGNLDAKRDWGFAGDYVEAIWLMLQQDEPEDFVIGTGEMHSVREFVEKAFQRANLNWQDHVVIDPLLYRPAEVDLLLADPTKAIKKLGWKPKMSFEDLVHSMVDEDIAQLKASTKVASVSRGVASDGALIAFASSVSGNDETGRLQVVPSGEPSRISATNPIQYPVASPDLSGNELAYVTECVESSWISSAGRFVPEFEKLVAAYSHADHGVAASNGTVALHLALVALGIGPGDEVIVPSLTFIATANAVTYCGATPVFADCDPDTWCISPASVARLITKKTKAIIPVHLYGHPCDMVALQAIVEDTGIRIVEDCAEAIGAEYAGKRVGSFGDAGVFSFFGNKIITTGEGGMVVTKDPELADRMRKLRGQGLASGKRYWHDAIGFNYRMTNIAAAIGVAQMETADVKVWRRRLIAHWYRECLGTDHSLQLPIEAPDCRNVFWMYTVVLDAAAQRDHLAKELELRGIETRPFFFPLNEMPMYATMRTDNGCPVSRDISYRGLCLPSSSYLNKSDVAHIATALKESRVASDKRYSRAA